MKTLAFGLFAAGIAFDGLCGFDPRYGRRVMFRHTTDKHLYERRWSSVCGTVANAGVRICKHLEPYFGGGCPGGSSSPPPLHQPGTSML
jgi:hypothetical protein